MYNNYGFTNPYYQPLQQQPIAQNNQLIAQNNIQNRQLLNGKMVDSIEVAKSSDYLLDGSTSYFPLLDGSAIVSKTLSTDGTSKVVVFKPIEEQKNANGYITHDDLEKALSDLMSNEIEDIKEDMKELKQEFKKMRESD